MANTPIYGWETPDDTDYVYQGAAAARTTANAIDSTVSTNFSTTNTNVTNLTNSVATSFSTSGYGVKSYFIDTSSLFVASSTETLWFRPNAQH